jgi:NAD(P)-dependent dehydrogenase (short-subunit alcohol dehydrogenase family)
LVREEFRLDGDVAVVAGCGRSRMKHVALALAEAGAVVVVTGSDEQALAGIVEQAGARGLEISALVSDPRSLKNIKSITQEILSRFGKIDILVNNFNLEFGKPFLEISEQEWRRVLDSNLNGVFLCSKILGKHMVHRKSGRIINIVAGPAERGLPNGAPYCVAMGAVVQLTRTLALEWAPVNVRVNAVGIGWMKEGADGDVQDPVARYIPMGRRGRGEDISPLVVFLASRASSYLSGSICYADGGLMGSY